MNVHFAGAEPDELWPLIQAHHYSRRMPSNIQHCYSIRLSGGLFGDKGDVIAGSIFSIPSTRWAEPVLELTRLVRSPDCSVPLSKLLSFSCDWLKRSGHALVVSYADWTQKHHGGIYQAAGWFYSGQRNRAMDGVTIDGVFKPGRSCNSLWGTRSPDKLRDLLPSKTIEPHFDEGKHLYWKPLAIAGRSKAKRLDLRRLQYPKPELATCPVDERLPSRASSAQPREVAP